MTSKQLSVLCVAPFNNPHITPIYDALADSKHLRVTRASLQPLSASRIKMGWNEMPADAPYLQPWRRKREWWDYFVQLWHSDFVIFPGYFHFRTLPFHHWLRRLSGKRTFAWSEPMKNHPRTLAKSGFRRATERVLIAPCNSAKNVFLAVGADAEHDYRQLGMTRWDYRQFLFAIKPPEISAFPPETHDTIKLVFCGSLDERKGIDLLIEAICDSELRNLDFRLLILGDGPLRQRLTKMCDNAGINAKVDFQGALPRDECIRLMSECDALVLPSRFDGWGAVVNEAMEVGLAIVVSDQVGSRRPLVQSGENGIIFASGNVDSLRDALKVMISDKEKLQSMRKQSSYRIQMYRPANAAAALEQLLLATAAQTTYEGQDEILQPC